MFKKTKNFLPSSLTIKQLLLFTIFLFLISPPPTFSQEPTETTAQSYYVSPNGKDTNPGTLNKPWQSIQYATDNNIVKPGDTVYIREGLYDESMNQKISGAPNKFVTYRNYPGETAIITHNNNNGSYRWLIKDQSYVRIQGLVFRDYIKGGIQVRTADKDLTNIEIIGNVFQNQTGANGDVYKTIHVSTLESGHYLYNFTIDGNKFYNMNTGGKPVLQVEGDVRGAKITNNLISGTSNIAIHIAGRPAIGQPERVLVKGNEVTQHGLPGDPIAGIYLDGAGKYIVVEENIVHDGRQGIKVNLEPPAASLQTEYVIVRRNITYNNFHINLKLGVGGVPDDCESGGLLKNSVAVHNTVYSDLEVTNHWQSCGKNLRWKNNTFVHVGNDGYQYRLENLTVSTSSWQSDYNHFHSTGTKPLRWFNKNYNTLSGFQSATGLESHSVSGNPLFVDVNQRDFNLTFGSPLRDAGGALTTTSGSGNGTAVPVHESMYFSDGLGQQPGDSIQIGSNSPATVVSVDYQNHVLVVDRPLSWSNNAPVSYSYSGSSPDIGAFEFVPTLLFSAIPQDKAILLTWQTNDNSLSDVTWEIQYHPADDTQDLTSIVNLPNNTRTYQLNGLENYKMYQITLSAVSDDQVVLTQTVNVMPTDIFTYLPLVSK